MQGKLTVTIDYSYEQEGRKDFSKEDETLLYMLAGRLTTLLAKTDIQLDVVNFEVEEDETPQVN